MLYLVISLLSVWTCVTFLVLRLAEPPILCEHLFIIMIWQLFLLSPCGIYMVGCLLLIVLVLFQPSTTHFGGWRYFWMDGGNHLCIHFHISVSLLCINGWHMSLTVISFIYAFIMHFALLCLILIHACVKGGSFT